MSDDRSKQFPPSPPPQPTGRTLVLLKRQVDVNVAKERIKNTIGTPAIDVREFGASTTAMNEAVSQGNAVVIPRFNIAILPQSAANQPQLGTLEVADEVHSVRPEFYMFAIDEFSDRYAKWVRDGLMLLVEGAASGFGAPRMKAVEAPSASAQFADNNDVTWGLQATGASRSAFTGRGIKAAVLDTGLDLEHADFSGRVIVQRNFVDSSASVMDGQGHGTHTAGTVAGPKMSHIGRSYGVAPDVELHIGKVLADNGSGREGDIINGMNWAIDQKCVAISMSLGRQVAIGEKPDPFYEQIGSAALAEGSLIIAAAGNDSARDFGFVAAVSAPANSPSIMAVAAVDPTLAVAPFSNGGRNSGGGEVNISGPGVSVYSSFPRPRMSRVLQGTSMACPHVAGVAALWAEADSSLRGQKLWDALVKSARPLGTASDFGSGLVQAPDVTPVV